MRDARGTVRNEAGLGRHTPAKLTRPATVHHFFSVEKQQRERLLGMLDVGQLAYGGARLPARRDTVTR